MIYSITTQPRRLCDAAREAMLPYLDQILWKSIKSVHAAGRETRAAIDNARDKLAGFPARKSHELIFTGGGTDRGNLPARSLPVSIFARRSHHLEQSGASRRPKRAGIFGKARRL